MDSEHEPDDTSEDSSDSDIEGVGATASASKY
jgi:hypothetical protein